MNRRELLRGMAASGAVLALTGCAAKGARNNPALPRRAPLNLPKVNVSPEREIRTIVGLRPFRPPGFRVAAEKLGDKLCVHNYGHGGAGITLSWGTAHLAAEMLRDGDCRDVAVIGCGVVGLASARLLQLMGKSVTIYAKALPPVTTSNVAGGLWKPFSVFDHDRATPAFRQQMDEATQFAYRYFQPLAGDYYGVRWVDTFLLGNEPFPKAEANPRIAYEPGWRELSRSEHNFPAAYVSQYQSMLIEPHSYLRALMQDFRLAGGRIIVREFGDKAQLAALPESCIVNCTGLGARQLFGDDELMPAKGQLTFMVPQPEVNYITLAPDLYMFPRRDGILLGGTFVRRDWSLEPDAAEKQRIIAGHQRLFRDLKRTGNFL